MNISQFQKLEHSNQKFLICVCVWKQIRTRSRKNQNWFYNISRKQLKFAIQQWKLHSDIIQRYDHLKLTKPMRNNRISIPKIVFSQFTNVRDLVNFCFHTHICERCWCLKKSNWLLVGFKFLSIFEALKLSNYFTFPIYFIAMENHS